MCEYGIGDVYDIRVGSTCPFPFTAAGDGGAEKPLAARTIAGGTVMRPCLKQTWEMVRV